jgi:hypothetical protein
MGTTSGLGLKAGAQWGQGAQQRSAADYMAAQYDRNAGAVTAASQIAAEEQAKKARLLASRVQANAAASGAGASDADVMKIISDIAGEGEYRSMLTRYEGSERARAMRQRADVTRYEGQVAERGGRLASINTILSGGKTLYDKYGQGGPKGYGTIDPTQAGEGFPY